MIWRRFLFLDTSASVILGWSETEQFMGAGKEGGASFLGRPWICFASGFCVSVYVGFSSVEQVANKCNCT